MTCIEKLFQLRRNSLEKRKQKLQESIAAHSRAFVHNELLRETNIEVTAMNACYVEALQNFSSKNHEIYQAYFDLFIDNHNLKDVQATFSIKSEITALKKEITARRATLRRLSVEDGATRQDIQYEIAGYETSIIRSKDKAVEKIIKLAEFMIERQELQIVANLFSNGAYINRAASYHVVEGMQKKQFIHYSRHVFVGSIVQQIGFFCWHWNFLVKEKFAMHVILYKVAKYASRILDLVIQTKFSEFFWGEVLTEEQNKLLLILQKIVQLKKTDPQNPTPLPEILKNIKIFVEEHKDLLQKDKTHELLTRLAVQVIVKIMKVNRKHMVSYR